MPAALDKIRCAGGEPVEVAALRWILATLDAVLVRSRLVVYVAHQKPRP
jgi:hypothetical protein